MVINVRGTSGSGKTTVVREIMAKTTEKLVIGDPKKPEGYRLGIDGLLPVYVVGPYENVCGGTDAIKTQDEICDRIRVYSTLGHVLVEGLLMSSSFARYAALDRELHARGEKFLWAFMDTPLAVCIARVEGRREERRALKGAEFKPFDPTNTASKWEDCRGTFERCLKMREKDWKRVVSPDGVRYPRAVLDARWVPHETAVETVFGWLHE